MSGFNWHRGMTFAHGLTTWPDFTSSILTGYTLITYTDYLTYPGVVLYDFIPSGRALVCELIAESAVALAYLHHIGAITQAIGAARGMALTLPRITMPALNLRVSLGAFGL
jgi:hypothetical protein